MADPSDYFGNDLYRTLGRTMPYGAIPFALAGNMPASTWRNGAADILGAPTDAMRWAAQQAGIRTNLTGAPMADAGMGSDQWRAGLGSLFGSLAGNAPTHQQPPPPSPPTGSPFNAPTPQPQQQQQPPLQVGPGAPGDIAGFMGTPVDLASYLLRKAGLSVPQNVPFGSEGWQRMLDRYNQVNRPNPPLTWNDIIAAARHVR
jgi:hypothetical protein